MKAKNFEYDSELDNFYIYSDNDEAIVGSLPFGNLIYDISVSGAVVKLEIDNASKVFNVSPKLLESAEDATLSITTTRNMLLLGFRIMLGKQTFVFSNSIPRNKINILA
jgi:uncharacterized protein YuzE